MIFEVLEIAIPLIWFGAVCAISLMGARPLKLTAPNIPIPLGPGIGLIVLHTLNKIEIALCILFAFFVARPKGKVPTATFAIIALVLIIQTFVLYPSPGEGAI